MVDRFSIHKHTPVAFGFYGVNRVYEIRLSVNSVLRVHTLHSYTDSFAVFILLHGLITLIKTTRSVPENKQRVRYKKLQWKDGSTSKSVLSCSRKKTYNKISGQLFKRQVSISSAENHIVDNSSSGKMQQFPNRETLRSPRTFSKKIRY